MPVFEVTIKIKCMSTAVDKDALAADLKRKEANKADLARIVQEWMNKPLGDEEV